MVLDIAKHYPVLLNEIISIITPQHGGTFIDCTFGQGGYSKKILSFEKTKIIDGMDKEGLVIIPRDSEFYDLLINSVKQKELSYIYVCIIYKKYYFYTHIFVIQQYDFHQESSAHESCFTF